MRQPNSSGPPFPDLTGAPFRLAQAVSPARVAAELVACFEAVAELREPTLRVFAATVAAIGLPPQAAIARAGRAIAVDIDREAANGCRNAYHNHQHTCEVMLCTLLLAGQHGLTLAAQARVLLAALIHDFRHDGTTNARVAFRLEHQAVVAACPYLTEAGVSAAERARIAAIVLATDLTTGAPFARRCVLRGDDAAWRQRGRGGKPTTPTAQDDLGALRLLACDRDLALQAVLVSEADLLPSVALTPDYGNRCQCRLARENRNIAPNAAAKLRFLNTYVPRLLVASFFTPNLERQRHLVARDGPTALPVAGNDAESRPGLASVCGGD